MPRGVSFRKDDRGAIAATYAIALLGLVAIAGVGFDYARMAGMHSELQNGADQAALAGASQLDKATGACSRASAAAVGMLRNVTLLANDGDADGNAVTIDPEPNCDATGFIRFWQDREGTTPATTDAQARFVEVVTTPRVARYALTPIVDAIDSGNMRARAMAGIGSAICRVPPLMICNPAEPTTNLNILLPFDVEANRGAGIKLVANNSYTPGAFGFLETGSGNSAQQLLAALGWDVRRGDCVSIDGVEVKEGLTASVMDGINTRFDMPGSGNSCPNIGGVTGQCSPAVNVRKDLVRRSSGNNISWAVHEGTASNFATEAYRPTSRALYPSSVTPRIMGHPRDLCHAWSNDGDCQLVNGNQSARLGNGEWDINAYWRSNFGTAYPAGTIATNSYDTVSRYAYPTRYQVYRWESERLVAGTLPGVTKSAGTNPAQAAYAQPQAGQMLALPSAPYGRVPGTDLDRRRLSVAVLNCSALTNPANGSNNLNNRELPVTTWIDIFMVEPAIARSRCQGGGSGCNNKYTENTDVYVELIGRTDIGGSSGANLQTIRRDTPYLVE